MRRHVAPAGRRYGLARRAEEVRLVATRVGLNGRREVTRVDMQSRPDRTWDGMQRRAGQNRTDTARVVAQARVGWGSQGQSRRMESSWVARASRAGWPRLGLERRADVTRFGVTGRRDLTRNGENRLVTEERPAWSRPVARDRLDRGMRRPVASDSLDETRHVARSWRDRTSRAAQSCQGAICRTAKDRMGLSHGHVAERIDQHRRGDAARKDRLRPAPSC